MPCGNRKRINLCNFQFILSNNFAMYAFFSSINNLSLDAIVLKSRTRSVSVSPVRNFRIYPIFIQFWRNKKLLSCRLPPGIATIGLGQVGTLPCLNSQWARIGFSEPSWDVPSLSNDVSPEINMFPGNFVWHPEPTAFSTFLIRNNFSKTSPFVIDY